MSLMLLAKDEGMEAFAGTCMVFNTPSHPRRSHQEESGKSKGRRRLRRRRRRLKKKKQKKKKIKDKQKGAEGLEGGGRKT